MWRWACPSSCICWWAHFADRASLLSHARESHTLAIRLASDDRSAGYELTTTWAQCHTQSTLLIMYLMLYSAPMTAKLWRVWSKIRNADTYRLELWDGRARRSRCCSWARSACCYFCT